MDAFVNLILEHWAYGLCAIVATLATTIGATLGLFKWIYRTIPLDETTQQNLSTIQDKLPVPLLLRPKHCNAPEDFGYLKGALIKVTGLAMRREYDRTPPQLELQPFPFVVEANVRCEFPMEKARFVRRLPYTRLICVVGWLDEGVKVDIHKNDVDLTLKNCHLVKPPIAIWLRYLWHELRLVIRYG